jgi:hypothetical protein
MHNKTVHLHQKNHRKTNYLKVKQLRSSNDDKKDQPTAQTPAAHLDSKNILSFIADSAKSCLNVYNVQKRTLLNGPAKIILKHILKLGRFNVNNALVLSNVWIV